MIGHTQSTLRAVMRAAGTSSNAGVETAAASGAFERMASDVLTRGGVKNLSGGDLATGWGIGPRRIYAVQDAEARGVRFINSSAAILHAQRKVNLPAVLEQAGVPHAAEGVSVRTRAELDSAVEALGGKARVTGGFPQSRVRLETSHVPEGLGRAPEPVDLLSTDGIEAFAASHLDHSRTFLVQALPEGKVMHAATAGNTVVHEIGTGPGLAPAERDLVAKAAQSFGLNAGGVDFIRGADGGLRVLDVHPTPRHMTEPELAKLAGSEQFIAGISGSTPATTAIPDRVEAAKLQIGVLNKGRKPGKNISRVMAEIERQGGSPVFMSAPATRVSRGGAVLLGDARTPIDAVLTRTGSVISNDALKTLGKLETRVPVVNDSASMARVRDKNIQALTLQAAGVPHPLTRVVTGSKDVQAAIDLIGPTMVLKNPASSEGRGVMFLDGEQAVRGVTDLFEHRAVDSRLIATRVGDDAGGFELASREDAERAVRELGDAVAVPDAVTGANLLQMRSSVRLSDTVTGKSVVIDKPVSILSIADAFRDAKPGANLKAETWYREAAGVDTRIHVAKDADGEYRILGAMERRVAPNEFGEARSNLALGGDATAVTPTAEQQRTALAAAKAFGLDVAGVDVIETANGPVVLEVNASPGLDIEKTTGAIADRWVTEATRRGAAHRAQQAQPATDALMGAVVGAAGALAVTATANQVERSRARSAVGAT